MAESEREPQLRLNKEQLKCLASAARYEIVTTLWALGSASARELAKATGRPLTSLYYHLELLSQAQLIRPTSSRKLVRNEEAVYEATSRRFLREEDNADPEHNEALLDSLLSSVQTAGRHYADAFRSTVPRQEKEAYMSLETLNVRLTSERAEQLRKEIHEALLRALESEKSEGPQGQRVSLTVVMAPVYRKKREPSEPDLD